MYLVAARITEIDFAVLNDGVRPIGNVERAVRSLFHIDRPEARATAANEIAQMLGGIAGAVFGKIKANNPVGTKITGDGLSLIFLWELRSIDDFQSGEFRKIPRARALHNAAAAGIGEIHRPGNGVADALKSGAIGNEGLAVAVEVVSPRIAPTAVLDAGLLRIGPEPHDAATLQAHDAVRCFQVAANVNGLVKVKPPIMPPAQGVQGVMSIFSAKAGQHDAFFISLAVAIGVLEMQ